MCIRDSFNIAISKRHPKNSMVDVLSLSWGIALPLSQQPMTCCCKVINMVGCVNGGGSHVIDTTGNACSVQSTHETRPHLVRLLWIEARVTCVWSHVWRQHQMTIIALIIAVPECDMHSCTIRNYGHGPSFCRCVYVICLACELV